MESASTIVQSILIFIVCVISLLLYLLPLGKKKQNLPLSIFLLIVGLHIYTDLTIESPILGSLTLHLLPSTFIFLYAPLLYFHTLSILKQTPKNHLLHLLPFILFLGAYFFTGFSNKVFFPIFGIQYLTYVVAIYKLSNQKNIKPIQQKWIRFITTSFGLIWLFAFVANVFGGFEMETIADKIELVSFLMAILFFIGLIYFTMSQPQIFMEVKLSASHQLSSSNSLSKQEKARMQALVRLFKDEKIHHEPDLNREMMAERLAIDIQQLSKEVNQYFKVNFPELINQYRIKEAKELLKDSSFTVKEVYFKVGFNSRSAFNNAFKKFTGSTPTEWKNQL